MKSMPKHSLLVTVIAVTMLFPYFAHADKKAMTKIWHPVVRISTTLGVIDIRLDRVKAPATVENFLGYVERGFYNGTIFHRVMPGFMIQGGGMQPGMKRKSPRDHIKNEADNGVKNIIGTIAMARTPEPHSATSQFFINTADNSDLDHRNKSIDGWGYAVFGKVINGMDVVKKIESVPTTRVGRYKNVPQADVVIKKIEFLKANK